MISTCGHKTHGPRTYGPCGKCGELASRCEACVSAGVGRREPAPPGALDPTWLVWQHAACAQPQLGLFAVRP